MYWIPSPEQVNEIILDCAQKNQDEYLDTYFSWGGEATNTDGDGRNAAHLFAMKGNLVGLGKIADDDMSALTVLDNFGMSPLMYLAERTKYDVLAYAKRKPQVLEQTDPEGRSVAGFVAARGDAETVVNGLLPLYPEMVAQRVIAMVMTSRLLSPKEKLKQVKLLAAAGFNPLTL